MLDVVIKRAAEEYISNFKVMLSFGVLFVFAALFALFPQYFFSSGTVFLSFNSQLLAVVGLFFALIFLYFFSFFVSLTVYAVHRDVQTINFDTYWNTLFKDAALKIFFLYLILSVVFYIISYIGFATGAMAWATVLNLIISIAIMFAPQSIVLNRSSLPDGVRSSIEFLAENPLVSILLFLLSTVLLLVIIGVEFVLGSLALPQIVVFFVSFFLVLVFLVPFTEQAKSYAYLLRVDLLKGNEVAHARAPKFDHSEKGLGVRLRERPHGGSKL